MSEILRKIEYIGFDPSSPVYKVLFDILTVIENANLSEEDQKTLYQLMSPEGFAEIYNVLEVREWSEFDYGNVKVGSLVKVKDDAYSSETGKAHNGRVGFLLDISGRRCLVRYVGTRGKSEMRHPIENLQSPKYGVK